MKRYKSIDLFKFLMAICVIAIHTEPLVDCDIPMIKALYDSIVYLAVPFFFISSGFLLGRKIPFDNYTDENLAGLLKYLVKLIKMYVIWSIIYIPLAILTYRWKGLGVGEAIIDYIKGFFIYGEHDFSWMLWYILAAIYAVAIIYILLKKHVKVGNILIFGTVLLIVGLVLDYFNMHADELPAFMALLGKGMGNTLGTSRILQGLFYIPLGMCLSQKDIKMPVAISSFVIAFVVSILVSSKEAYFTLCMMVASFGLFELIIRINLKDRKIYGMLGCASMVMYFTHLYAWRVICEVLYDHVTSGFIPFILTTISTVVLGFIYYFYKNTRKNKQR